MRMGMTQDWLIIGPEATCLECEQVTDAYERDALPEVQHLLKWKRFCKVTKWEKLRFCKVYLDNVQNSCPYDCGKCSRLRNLHFAEALLQRVNCI